MRRGFFDGGLIFNETITDWQPEQRLKFAIEVEGDANVPAPFNEIGRAMFDVLHATYTIEPLANGSVILHLSSTHRFNGYGGLWTDAIMRDFQMYVLDIVRQRCEHA